MTATAPELAFTHMNKDGWGDGPWDREPDKVQWVDPGTGLVCLASRGPGGQWCGYVGVPPSHPWFGKGYNDCLTGEGCAEDWHYECAPAGRVSVHGGLTFAGAPYDPSREDWEKARTTRRQQAEAGAATYPRGDYARWLAKWVPVLDDFDAWRDLALRAHVCLRGVEGTVWLFGFDCAHLGDMTPGFESAGLRDGTYKDLGYVRRECADLARQLAAVGK